MDTKINKDIPTVNFSAFPENITSPQAVLHAFLGW